MILLIWFSSKVRKCLRSTASPLCLICLLFAVIRIAVQESSCIRGIPKQPKNEKSFQAAECLFMLQFDRLEFEIQLDSLS